MPDNMPELTPPTPPEGEAFDDNFIEETPPTGTPSAASQPPAAPQAMPEPPAVESRATLPPQPEAPVDDMSARLERLGGEPAPVITPDEFARLQNAGQVHIDAMGRVRTARRASQADAGVTLRKRRAWY
ncbi:MAG: hypothetical protein IPM16_16045 [Chloroflexi bacterium]|nr:hypothetical protein [Chloroflexota bacterium]